MDSTQHGRLRRPAAVLALASTVGLAACGSGSSGGAQSAGDARSGGGTRGTRVVKIVPFTEHGIAAGYREHTGEGSCWATSELAGRTDSYRCEGQAGILDPCFSSPYPSSANKVACPTAPDELDVLNLTEPLPDQGNGAGYDRVWMVVLTGGDQCARTSGAGPQPRGQLYFAMACRSGSMLWGEPDRNHPLWTMRRSKNEQSPLSTVTVVAAYR